MANVIQKVPAGTQVLYNGGATGPGGLARNAGGQGTMRPMTPGRNLLQYLRQKYQGQSITESKLRVEVLLNNNNNQYNFDVLKTSADAATETKLDKNDVFGIDRVGFFLTQRTTANAGNEELLTFPNNSLLDSTNVVVKDFYAIYNGTFQVTIGTTLVYPSMPMEKFLYVPITQKDTVNAAIAATSSWTSPTVGAGTYGPFENQRDLNSSYFEISNILELSGGAQNLLQVNVLAFSGMKLATVTGGIGNYLVMILDGFLVKNAAYRGLAL